MDYETISIENSCHCNCNPYWVDHDPNLGWDRGEITEILLTFKGEIASGNYLLTPEEFLRDSSTKFIQMTLKNFRGDIVDIQRALAREDIEYHRGNASFYYIVPKELSERLPTGSYSLFVNLINTIPRTRYVEERTIFNLLLTSPEGIDITIT